MKTSVEVPSLAVLMNCARSAGEIMTKNFCLGMEKQWKDDGTPVTASDIAINEMVIRTIGATYPGVRVIGEEGSNDVLESDVLVIFDPVDGTIMFGCGAPISAFCAAVIVHGIVETAVIFDPFLNRMWTARRGEGAFLNDMLVRVSEQSKVKGSRICSIWWPKAEYNMHAVMQNFMDAGGGWFNPASIAYFGGLVASGEIDATIFPNQQGWETAAMSLIVEEAGGRATDILGKPLVFGPNGEIEGHIISNGLIHDELVELVSKAQPW